MECPKNFNFNVLTTLSKSSVRNPNSAFKKHSNSTSGILYLRHWTRLLKTHPF